MSTEFESLALLELPTATPLAVELHRGRERLRRRVGGEGEEAGEPDGRDHPPPNPRHETPRNSIIDEPL